MKRIVGCLATLLLLSSQTYAQNKKRLLPNTVEGVWGIGSTGIMCYRPPCPWRGTFVHDPENTAPRSAQAIIPLLPRLDASEDDRREIETAWKEFRCVLVKGRMQDGILKVDRIAGKC